MRAFAWSLAAALICPSGALAEDSPAPAAGADADEGVEAASPIDAAAKQREDAAKAAYTQAATAAGKGELEAALELYRKADELVPAPAPKFKVALTLDKLERLSDAAAAYEAFLDSKPDPDKFFAKIESAKARIRALKEVPGRINVTTTPPSPPNLVLAVDRVPQAGNEIAVMPGTHTVTAVADGLTGSQTIVVGPAETKDVVIALVADRPLTTIVAPPPPPAPILAAPPAAAPSSRQARTAAYVMFGVAGVQAIVGTVFAVQAVHAKRVYDASPSTRSLDSVDRQTVFATAFYATGLVSVVTGVVLLLVDDAR